jgi:hypothetical protein
MEYETGMTETRNVNYWSESPTRPIGRPAFRCEDIQTKERGQEGVE